MTVVERGNQFYPEYLPPPALTKAQIKMNHFIRILGQERVEELGKIEIKTVDGFEGREKEVILFSTVRSNARGFIGFLCDWRRLNVGITRAKRVGSPISCGHIPFLPYRAPFRPLSFTLVLATRNMSSQVNIDGDDQVYLKSESLASEPMALEITFTPAPNPASYLYHS